MADTDLRDFACPVCFAWLPDYCVHGEKGAYCSVACRDEEEPDYDRDEDEA